MTTSYVPRPGSDGARALEILVARGERMLGADLADEIDVDPHSLQGRITYALREGVIAIEKIDNRNWYSVGNGEPIAALPAADPAPPPPLRARARKQPKAARKVAKAPKPKRLPKPAVRLKRAKPRKARPPEAGVLNRAIAARSELAVITPAPSPRPAPSSGLQCALFNTGALLIKTKTGTTKELTADETRDLVAYLKKLDQLALSAAERATA